MSLWVVVMLQQLAVIKRDTTFVTASPRTTHLPGDDWNREETRAARIEALRGRYRDVLTPSEEFARQKAEEALRE